MKHWGLLFLWCTLPLLSLWAQAAQTLYITDEVRIPIRKDKSTSSEIVNFVFVGDAVEVIEANQGGWSKVRHREAEGWLLSQYLVTKQSDTRPDVTDSALLELDVKYRKTETNLANLQRNLAEIRAQNVLLNQENNKLKSEIEFMQKTYEKNIQIEYRSQQLANELVLSKNQIEFLKQQNSVREESSDQAWFLIGAVTFLGGLLLGVFFVRFFRKKY